MAPPLSGCDYIYLTSGAFKRGEAQNEIEKGVKRDGVPLI
jgi:hypothetical protein